MLAALWVVAPALGADSAAKPRAIGCARSLAMSARGPVLDAAAWQALQAASPSGAAYTDPPRGGGPALPLIAFGVAYELDLVLVSDHPAWNMHELARLRVPPSLSPDGVVWLAKDAREDTLEQSIAADLPADVLRDVLPEVPVARRSGLVVEQGDAAEIDVVARYANALGQPMELRFRGRLPKPQRARNGPTLGHSATSLLAVLDVAAARFGSWASVSIDGEERPLRKAAGLLPLRVALAQSQAGLAVGAWTPRPAEGGPRVEIQRRPAADGGGGQRAWRSEPVDGGVELVEADALRTFRYRFARRADSLELARVTVEQYARDEPVLDLVFEPTLPDLRRPFDGAVRVRYGIAVNGQPGLAMGIVTAYSDPQGACWTLTPEAPCWTTDRPLEGRLTFDDSGVVHGEVRRLPLPPQYERCAAAGG